MTWISWLLVWLLLAALCLAWVERMIILDLMRVIAQQDAVIRGHFKRCE